MGLMSLLGMLETGSDLEQVMRWHLESNCYPPVNPEYIPMCLEAVKLYNDAAPDEIAMLLDKELSLPKGLVYQNDKTTAPWRAIVDNFHLEGFLQTIEGDSEDEENNDIEN